MNTVMMLPQTQTLEPNQGARCASEQLNGHDHKAAGEGEEEISSGPGRL